MTHFVPNRRFPLRVFRSPGRRWLAGALVAVVCITAAAGSVGGGASSSGITVTADFADASPLLIGNDVKVDGVAVGQVVSMKVVDGHLAAVKLSLDRSALPIHADAVATIKPVSLLGERYVDLQRGTPSGPVLANGGVLPATQTATEPDLYEVLNTIDDPTGQSLAALVTMLGDGLQGNGANAAATIRELRSAMKNTDGMVKVLGQQNTLLNDLVDKLEPVAAELVTDNGKTLSGLVQSVRQATTAAAANQRQLAQTVIDLPSTLRQARATLAQLSGTAQAATPDLQAIRPVTDNLNAISDELTQFADAADPALVSATPVLERAQQLLAMARPVADQLSQGAPALRNTISAIRPLATSLLGNLTNVLDFIRYWALTTNGYDGISHYFRAMVTINTDVVTGLIPGGAPNQAPTPTGAKPSTSPTSSSGILSGVLGGVQGVLGGLGSLLSPQKSPSSTATGLNTNQESGLLGLLLGAH